MIIVVETYTPGSSQQPAALVDTHSFKDDLSGAQAAAEMAREQGLVVRVLCKGD